MGKKAKERKEFMKEISAKNCDPNNNWPGLAFPKIRKACSKLEATVSQNAQDAQTAAIISAATDPSIGGGGGAVGATDGATEPKSNMPLIIGGSIFGVLVLATIAIVVIRNRNAAAGVAPTA
jgi:hypothetical protein